MDLQNRLKNECIANVARATGLHVNTIYIVRDDKGNPTQKTINKLEKYFKEKNK